MAQEFRIAVSLEKISHLVNRSLPAMLLGFFFLGYQISFYFHFLTVIFFFINLINLHYLFIQKKHALLSNFGILANIRYMLESVGPEFRQYLYSSDTEERPFNRQERSEVYRMAKGDDSTTSFGTQMNYDQTELKLRHSFYPSKKSEFEPYHLVFGEERGSPQTFTLTKPLLISAMSYGALGENAIRALSRGAGMAGIPMNTGEGGWPKYHLMEKADLIFQMGTAKFGVRHNDGTLHEDKLRELAQQPQIKMIEIKFSQGAKPGKGGLLPKEKITVEIAELRGVEVGHDVVSPPYHSECEDPAGTVAFIRRVQEISELPVGVKFCLGRAQELQALVNEMKKQKIFPDYINVDGAEGGTGAAPKSFMDDLGLPLFRALPLVQELLVEAGVRDKLKLLCAGKLISPGKQFMAMSMGAQAIYSARGFMLALGCIQALQCNKNTCPVGITTHQKHLQGGLDIADKAKRIENYVHALLHEHEELLGAMGAKSYADLNIKNLYQPEGYFA